jgi:hypothetical protein
MGAAFEPKVEIVPVSSLRIDPRNPRKRLRDLIENPKVSVESIAVREGCTTRKVTMTISLAFLAPDLVKAAIEGRLPYGFA